MRRIAMGFQNARLTVIKGFNKGQVYPLDLDEITIGRGEENGIVLNIAEVSRTHAMLIREEGGYIIKDMESTNGTFVDKKRIGDKYLLKPGDTIMLGDAIYLTYEADLDSEATLVSPRPDIMEVQEDTAVTPKPAAREKAPAKPTTPKKKQAAVESLTQDQITEEKKSKTWLWAGIGCLVVIFFLMVIGLIVFDYLNLYCTPPFDSLLSFLYTCSP
jgi:pSer/pThr/pTyr-binding forkhead associated (FHA) protein